MKYFLKQIIIIIDLIFLSLFISCAREEGEAKVSTTGITEITTTSAKASGDITDLGYGIDNYGHCWNLTEMPDIYNSRNTRTNFGSIMKTGIFVSDLVDLAPNTHYYVRAYAENSAGTVYGSQVDFMTGETNMIFFNPKLTYGTVNDIDGNEYKTIQIGSQTWMAENLKTIKYNDNSNIPLVFDDNTWEILNSPGYCWYNNDSSTYKVQFGALYNWYAVNTGKLCPTGWHIPNITEWTTLVNFLGGPGTAIGKLKEQGTAHWIVSNTDATNLSGFTALPSGYRYFDGPFDNILLADCWWLEDEYSAFEAFYTGINIRSVTLGFFPEIMNWGFSVRCLQD